MPTQTFTIIRRTASRQGHCPLCGTRVIRSRTFEQTINPFNRNESGTVKTHSEVTHSVSAEAEAWNPPAEDFTHDKCLLAAGNEPQDRSAGVEE